MDKQLSQSSDESHQPQIKEKGEFVLEGAKNSDLIIWYLEQLGVEFVFGIPGGAIAPLYDALARSQAKGGIRPVVARHETGASFMADGYTRESGTMGVCCATTGPGSTNLITGVASAYENEIPQLVITAQTPLSTFGKNAFQESSCTGVNILGMFQHCTRYNSLVSHSAQLETKLIAAIMTAHSSPRGPVHLSIPVDILRMPVISKPQAIDLNAVIRPHGLIDQEQLPLLLDEICQAKKIVCVVGAGCSGIAHTVLELVNVLGMPVITSTDGKGLISPQHPLYRGVFGFAGHTSAVETLQDPDVDLVLLIGTNLSEWATGGWDEKSLLNRKLVHIDSVDSHFMNSVMARLQVVGSIQRICKWLVFELHKRGYSGTVVKPLRTADELKAGSMNHPGFEVQAPEKCRDDSAPIKPQRLMTDLSRLFPPNTRFLADTGNSFAWATHYLHAADRRLYNRRGVKRPSALEPGRRMQGKSLADTSLYRASIDFASMGWAIGAAVGTAMANPDCPVVCITGDGSYLMSGQEITVAKVQQRTVIYVVLNDGALGMVKHGQLLARDEQIGFELPEVNFCQLGRAMGIDAYEINSPTDLESLDFEAICHKKGPTLLDVRVDPNEVPPIGLRVRLLEKAAKSVRNINERKQGNDQK